MLHIESIVFEDVHILMTQTLKFLKQNVDMYKTSLYYFNEPYFGSKETDTQKIINII